MGDPAGIGPETIAKAMNSGQLDPVEYLVLGNSRVMTRAIELVESPQQIVSVRSWSEYCTARESWQSGQILCWDCTESGAADVSPATIDPRGGEAAYQATALAARLAMESKIDAMVTSPLHKEALHLAGHHWPGHTEMLAELCGVQQVAMMLYLPPYDANDPTVAGLPPRLRLGPLGLGVGHTTLHIGMQDAIDSLTQDRILETARLVTSIMQQFGKVLAPQHQVSIGVAALNPHAGENGLFGNEEQTLIEPAIKVGKGEGLPLSSALPCDTLMVRAAAGEFDGIVAMYHDQGHIALKLMGMQRAVNIALGLPIVRTSVAHGTAFDRAWKGTAHFESLIHAIRVARQLSQTTQE